MKRISIIFLACILCLGVLSGCGTDDKEAVGKENSNTSSQIKNENSESSVSTTEANVGDILDKPEIELELEKFYIYLSYADETAENGISSMELAMDDTGDIGVIYVTDGLLKLNETIYELDAEGNVTKYFKDVFNTEFLKDETSSQASLSDEKDNMMGMLQMVGFNFAELNPNYKYRKGENKTSLHTGDVFVYELLEDNTSAGSIWIDKKTGIIVKLLDENEENIMTVQTISTTELGIPEYK